jgi:DNA polymerase-3 subunit epsilon
VILFYDTETTGFYDDRLPPDHDGQPHLVQLAALLTEDDGTDVMSVSLVVNPGVPIPTRASDVHGITTDIAQARGVAPAAAVHLFGHLYNLADLIVAHNVKFDKGIMEVAATRRHGKPFELIKPTFCTMEAATPVVNLPPTERMLAAGFNKPKPPKLEECIAHFFGEALEGAHDAMIDVTACRRVFFHLKTMKEAA